MPARQGAVGTVARQSPSARAASKIGARSGPACKASPRRRAPASFREPWPAWLHRQLPGSAVPASLVALRPAPTRRCPSRCRHGISDLLMTVIGAGRMAVHKLSGLEYLVAVIDSGGFDAAARRLGVTTASVHRLVLALETELGVVLVDRSTRAGLPPVRRADRPDGWRRRVSGGGRPASAQGQALPWELTNGISCARPRARASRRPAASVERSSARLRTRARGSHRVVVRGPRVRAASADPGG